MSVSLATRFLPGRPERARCGARADLRLSTTGLLLLALACGGWARGQERAGDPDPVAGAEQGVEVETRAGRWRGRLESDVLAFRGIYYGEDTRPRRFQPSAAEPPWEGVRDALAFAPRCPQVAPPGADVSIEGMSEDCLSLNLWTPVRTQGKSLPVLVYLHGGGYANGTVNEPVYDGAALVRRGQVVVVTVNHRLNGFGYLYLAPWGGAAFADSGTVGQQDLLLALRWVQDNIARFGGDPGSVTLFGQSGGGAKIATLMAMPASRGLFHRAWTMSGQQITGRRAANAERTTSEVLTRLGVPGDAEPRQKLEALLAADLPTLMAALRGGEWTPVVDGRGLPRDPFSPDAPPQSSALPMVLGNTREETTSLIGRADPTLWTLQWPDLAAALQRHVGAFLGDLDAATIVDAYRRWYPDRSPSDVFFAASTAARSWKGMVIASERRARQGAPTWVYHLHWRSPFEGGRYGAPHTVDIPLVFGTLAADAWTRGFEAQARPVSEAMMDALIAFAYTGDPSTRERLHWPRFDLERRATLIFDERIRVEDDPRGRERRLFEQVPYLQPGT